MSVPAVVFLAASALLAGYAVLGTRSVEPTAGLPARLVGSAPAALAAGLVLLHLALGAADALGLGWSRGLLVVLGGCGIAAGLGRLRQGDTSEAAPRRRRRPSGLGWGDAAALLAVAGFAVAAFELRATLPDFVYHIGIKAQKHALAGGFDWAYLERPWNHFAHPEYPRLPPLLFAASARLAGRFSEPALMLWSVLFWALLLVETRSLLGLARLPTILRQAALAVVALGVGAFLLASEAAGGADLPLALALLVAAGPLLERGPFGQENYQSHQSRADLRLGAAAAFAAALKMEGMVLAAILLALHAAGGAGWRSPRGGGRAAGRAMRQPTSRAERRAGLAERDEIHGKTRPVLRTATVRLVRSLPLPAAVVALWAVQTFGHGLWPAGYGTGFDAGRLVPVLAAVPRYLSIEPWHGVAWALALVPLALLYRAPRRLALAILAQLAFYLLVYLGSPAPPEVYMALSFPRLLLHLVPASLVAAAFLAEGLPGRVEEASGGVPAPAAPGDGAQDQGQQEE